MRMRLGVLGDIHTEDVRLAAALAHLRALDVVAILSVGDVVDGPGDVERCVRLLDEASVVGVRGNHDRWLVAGTFLADDDRKRMGWNVRADLSPDALAWLANLPATRTFETPRGELLLCHGLGDDDMVRFVPPGDSEELDELAQSYALVVAGHTHERFVHRVQARGAQPCFLVNAGTLSTRGEPGFALLDVDGGVVEWFDVDERGHVTQALAVRFAAPL